MDITQPHTYFSEELRDLYGFRLKVRADFDDHWQDLVLEVSMFELPKHQIKKLRDLLNTLPLGD